MTNLKIIDAALLDTVTGGEFNAPLSGNVTQQINTNWGGTQIINEAKKTTNSIVEFMRTNPEARLKKIMGEARKIRRL